ncbi:hypothetical protein HHI36_005524 [Cryptolaemus montrouzieri]|uniref:Uncharacterized protein n=1 Tax=Cryptolaemus montrouzieri TaxID=559131 RepID=A0ABD2NUA4_9CUCU
MDAGEATDYFPPNSEIRKCELQALKSQLKVQENMFTGSIKQSETETETSFQSQTRLRRSRIIGNEGTDDIFSVSCNSGNPTVLHLTRLRNVNDNILPKPSNESYSDENVNDSDGDPNFSIRSHQSSSWSSVRSENESSEQSEVEIEEIEEVEGEKKAKKNLKHG